MKKAWLPLALLVISFAGNLAASPDPQWEKYWEKGKKAYDLKDYETAVANFEKAAAAAPENGDVKRWLGSAYFLNGQYRETIGAQQRAVKLLQGKDSEKECWLWMGSAQGRLGEWEALIVSYTKLVELDPLNPVVFLGLAKAYTETKRYGEALTAAKRAVDIDSSDANYLKSLGTAYWNIKKIDEGSEAFKKAILIDPGDWESHYWLGEIDFARNDYAAALEAYKKASELAPQMVNGMVGIAVTNMRMGRYDDAIDVLNNIARLQTYTGIGISQAIESGYPIAKTVFADGPAEEAGIKAGDKIVRIDGKSTKGLTAGQTSDALRGNLGDKVVLTIENSETSKRVEIAVVREAMLSADAAGTFGARSLANRAKGAAEAALQDAEKAFSLNPNQSWARLSLATARLDAGRYEEAVRILSAAEKPHHRLLYAAAVFKQGKTQEAAEIYSAIPEEDMPPQNVMLAAERTALLKLFKPLADEHRAKARLFELKKQYPEALVELSEALKIADTTERALLQDALFDIVRKNPASMVLPDEARKHALRAELEIKEGSFEQAAKEYGLAIRIAPYAVRLYYNAALVRSEMKDYPEAIRLMATYLKAMPDASDAQMAKDEIVKWEFALEKGRGR